jgi:hypothetical protein
MTVNMSGARGGRTLTLLPTTDFKSVASADSAIAPAGEILPNTSVCRPVLPSFQTSLWFAHSRGRDRAQEE